MRSLRDYSGSNIFRYHDFAEDERELVSTEAPYIIFTDEDLAANYAAPEAEEEAETPEAWEDAESQEELAGEEGDGGSKESAEASFAALLVEKAEKEAESITAEAREKADAALAEAELKASEIFAAANKEGYEKGYDKGFADGSEEGANRAQSASRDRWRRFFGAVDEACWDIDARKAEILQKNIDDLTELTLAIAEKVVCVSLESSGEVIKRMILAAAAPAGDEQWAKVVISAADADLMGEEGIDIRGELAAISEKIDLVAMDGADPGTCLVEFPSHVTDAGAGIKMQNIKDFVRGADREQEAGFVL